jgi:hypothetical protein
MTTPKPKFCKDCKHYFPLGQKCFRLTTTQFDLVTGEPYTLGALIASTERKSAYPAGCSEQAWYFVNKPRVHLWDGT